MAVGRTNTGGGAVIKYATGTVQINGAEGEIQTITVSGLGFRPYAVCMRGGNPYSCGIGACDASGAAVAARVVSNTDHGISTAVFTPNSDGFSIQAKTTKLAPDTWTWFAYGP